MNNINEKYLSIIEDIMKNELPLEDRKIYIEKINEDYFQETGENLPSFMLESLGTWLLKETYADKRTNKVAIEEFPVLSESQMIRRRRKTVHISEEEVLETLNFHLRNNSSTSKREDARSEELGGGTHEGRY